MHNSQLIRHSRSATPPVSRRPREPRRRGRAQGEILRIRDAAVRAEEGASSSSGAKTITGGSTADARRPFRSTRRERRFSRVSWTATHTRSGRETAAKRSPGGSPEKSYASIAARGGGIVATVAATRAAKDEELRSLVAGRLSRMLSCGTTTVEAKSGYGLTAEEELRALRLLASLASPDLPRIVPTLLAAHEIPAEYRQRRGEWVRIVAEDLVPLCARRAAGPLLRRLLRGGRLHGPGIAPDPRGGEGRGAGNPDPRRRALPFRGRSARRRSSPPTRPTTCSASVQTRSRPSPARERSRSSCRGPPGGCVRPRRPPAR